MLGWLFRRRVTREEAIRIATRFMAEHGCQVVGPDAADADGCFVLIGADLPTRRWYVRFERHPRSGIASTGDPDVVWVHSETGHAEFPHPGQ